MASSSRSQPVVVDDLKTVNDEISSDHEGTKAQLEGEADDEQLVCDSARREEQD